MQFPTLNAAMKNLNIKINFHTSNFHFGNSNEDGTRLLKFDVNIKFHGIKSHGNNNGQSWSNNIWWSSLTPENLTRIAQSKYLRHQLYQSICNFDTIDKMKQLSLQYLIINMNKTNYCDDLQLLSSNGVNINAIPNFFRKRNIPT